MSGNWSVKEIGETGKDRVHNWPTQRAFRVPDWGLEGEWALCVKKRRAYRLKWCIGDFARYGVVAGRGQRSGSSSQNISTIKNRDLFSNI